MIPIIIHVFPPVHVACRIAHGVYHHSCCRRHTGAFTGVRRHLTRSWYRHFIHRERTGGFPTDTWRRTLSSEENRTNTDRTNPAGAKLLDGMSSYAATPTKHLSNRAGRMRREYRDITAVSPQFGLPRLAVCSPYGLLGRDPHTGNPDHHCSSVYFRAIELSPQHLHMQRANRRWHSTAHRRFRCSWV